MVSIEKKKKKERERERESTTPACILCGERQTLLHVLNACPYALNRRRYNNRHDAILMHIRDFLAGQLSPSQSITADLPN